MFTSSAVYIPFFCYGSLKLAQAAASMWGTDSLGVCKKLFSPSVPLSSSVGSNSLRPHESQHARPPCPSQTPRVYSNSYPSSRWCHPAISSSVIPFSSCPLSLLASGSFPMTTVHMRQPKYWSFSFSITPSNEHPGLIFRMDWLDLLAVQGTLKSLLQHHNSKASVIWCSAFFTVQLSHPYMTAGKTIALTRQTFLGKVMSLLFNMLSKLVITFLPRSKRLLISWLQSPSAVILEPKKVKSDTVSTVSPSISHEVMGPDASVHFIQKALLCFVFLSWNTFPGCVVFRRFHAPSASLWLVIQLQLSLISSKAVCFQVKISWHHLFVPDDFHSGSFYTRSLLLPLGVGQLI